MRKQLLFLTSRFPFPLNKGAKLRALYQIKELRRWMDVHLVSISEKQPTPEEWNAVNTHCKSMHNYVIGKPQRYAQTLTDLLGSRPPSVSYFYRPWVQKKIDRLLAEIEPDIIHCHLIRMVEYVKNIEHIPRSIDFMDCFSLGAKKELSQSLPPLRKQIVKMEYRRLGRYEKKCTSLFDHQFIISATDRSALPGAKASKVEILANGVDRSAFYPGNRTKKFDLLFSGHMGYVPNIAAAKYAITKIHALLKPSVSMLVAGIGITEDIKQLKQTNLVLQEEFTHIREAFWQSRILLAPMTISIGLQNKILQAMAMRMPVVCSPQANKAIQAPVGSAVLVADRPDEYVKAIERLLMDATFFESIADAGYQFVTENFVWEEVNRPLVRALASPLHPNKKNASSGLGLGQENHKKNTIHE